MGILIPKIWKYETQNIFSIRYCVIFLRINVTEKNFPKCLKEFLPHGIECIYSSPTPETFQSKWKIIFIFMKQNGNIPHNISWLRHIISCCYGVTGQFLLAKWVECFPESVNILPFIMLTSDGHKRCSKMQ